MKTLYLSLLLLASACHSNDASFKFAEGDYSNDYEAITYIPATQQPVPKKSSTEITQKLIKRGGINFESENIETDFEKISNLLPQYKAYLESENQSKSDQYSRYELTIRVPAENYDSLINQISALAYKLENKYSNIEDVTERYYDLQSRITNQKALEQRYLELLNKAASMQDILEIERNLTEVRTTIEQLEGQFKYLSKQIGYSTLDVSFYEQLPYVYNESGRKGFFARIASALSSGWTGFLSFLVGLVSLWPFLILFGILFILFRKWRAKRAIRKLED